MWLRPEVAHRHAPGVHQAAEGPQGVEEPGRGGVDAVDERRPGDQRGVRVEHEEAPEPRSDRLAVVVAAAQQVLADRRVHARDEHHAEQQVGERGRCAWSSRAPAASVSRRASSSTKPASITRPESVPGRDRHRVVQVLRDAERDSVSDDGTSSPRTWPPSTAKSPRWNSEHGRAQAPALQELGRARRPAELVVAVAPDVPDHEHRHRGVGQHDPQQQVDRGSSRRLPSSRRSRRRERGGPARASPRAGRRARGPRTPRAGPRGPAAAARRARRRCSSGSSRQSAASSPAYGLSARSSESRMSSITGRNSASSSPPASGSSAANSSTTGRWSGSSGPSSSSPPRRSAGAGRAARGRAGGGRRGCSR